MINVKGVGPAYTLAEMEEMFDRGWDARGKLIGMSEREQAAIYAKLLDRFRAQVIDDTSKR